MIEIFFPKTLFVKTNRVRSDKNEKINAGNLTASLASKSNFHKSEEISE
jgi:hypothetical protein